MEEVRVRHPDVGGQVRSKSGHVDIGQIRTKAWKLCRNFLQGAWADIKPEEMEIDELW
jgi:hypothetical protein